MLDLRLYGQSDVTGAEKRGVFGGLWVSRFLQSGRQESQCGWCVISSFAPVCLSPQLEFWSADRRLLCSLSRNLSFISFFSFDRIRLGFLCFLPQRSRIGRKITFNYFYFLTNFIDISLCTDPIRRNPFSRFWRKSLHR